MTNAKKGVVLSSLRDDLAAEKEGRWMDTKWGFRLLVKSHNCPEFVMAQSEAARKWAEENPGVAMPEATMIDVAGTLAAKFLLVDWEGVVDDNGEPIPLTGSTAHTVLTDPAHRMLRTEVYRLAQEVGRAKLVFVEEAVKKYPAPSATI